jgi:hypothetical protein
MRLFDREIVLGILHKRGPTEIQSLVRAVLGSTPRKKRKSEGKLTYDILVAAAKTEEGITIVEYPKYILRNPLKSLKPPDMAGKLYAQTMLLALQETTQPMLLPALVERHKARCRPRAIC